jgi:hypothetical protein
LGSLLRGEGKGCFKPGRPKKAIFEKLPSLSHVFVSVFGSIVTVTSKNQMEGKNNINIGHITKRKNSAVSNQNKNGGHWSLYAGLINLAVRPRITP